MSTLAPYEYSSDTTIVCIWVWERCRPSLWKWLQKKNEKEKRYLLMFNFPLTKSLQQGKKTARKKQYFQYCILCLVVFTRFRANRDCLLKLCVNQISKKFLVSFTRKYVSTLGLLHMVSWGWCNNTLLLCKLVFTLLTIDLWHRAGLLKVWVAASNGAAKCNFGISKPIGLTNQI